MTLLEKKKEKKGKKIKFFTILGGIVGFFRKNVKILKKSMPISRKKRKKSLKSVPIKKLVCFFLKKNGKTTLERGKIG